MAITRTQKKRQDQILREWLLDHGIPSIDEFLDNYFLIRVADPELLEDLDKRMRLSSTKEMSQNE